MNSKDINRVMTSNHAERKLMQSNTLASDLN